MPTQTPDDQPDALTQLIWEQSMAGAAIPVVLFGPADRDVSTAVTAGRSPAFDTRSLERRDDDLPAVGEDLIDLYSAEAYVVQCDYGRRIIDPRIVDQG